MKKPPRSLFVGIVISEIAILVIAFMMLLRFVFIDESDYSFKNYFDSELVDSESVYTLVIFSIVLLIALVVLTVSVFTVLIPLKKKYARIRKPKTKRRDKKKARFPQLTRIDKEEAGKTIAEYEEIELCKLCERFRDFAAGRLGLYYDISDIRRFVAGMGISKLMILRGMSGTGKTSLAYAAGEFFCNPSTVVPIQPMWKERSDMIGYFNEFTKKFSETTMLCKLYEAGGSSDVYVTVLDEVNISRIEYYFAEFLSVLELPESSKRYIDVVSDSWPDDPKRLENGRLRLPVNMWFVGTANNDDSTFAISDKVYDRAVVIDLEKKCAPFTVQEDVSACHVSYDALNGLYAEAKKKYMLSGESREKLKRLDEYLIEVFKISFGNRIMKQIEEYVPIMIACGGSELQALDDIISRKILRKLEQLSPAFVKSESDALLSFIDKLFGADFFIQSRRYIEGLQKGY